MKTFLSIFILLSPLTILCLHPSKTYKQTPADLNLNYEQITIQTPDGYQLNSWYFQSNKTDKLIIFCHDGVENMGQNLNRVKLLLHYGFSVLTFDYRGYGQSSDFPIENYQFIYPEFFVDLESVVKYSTRTLNKEIIVYGWGIGSVISIASGFSHEKVSGIIVDDIFPSFENVKLKFTQMNALMTIPKGFYDSKFNVLDIVQKTPGKRLTGILFFFGSNNLFCTPAEMENILAQTNLKNKNLVTVMQSQKVNNFDANPSQYVKEIYQFAMVL